MILHPMRVLEYEQHAAECRRMADETKNPRCKKQLEDMAEVRDRLAYGRRQGINEYGGFPQEARQLRHVLKL